MGQKELGASGGTGTRRKESGCGLRRFLSRCLLVGGVALAPGCGEPGIDGYLPGYIESGGRLADVTVGMTSSYRHRREYQDTTPWFSRPEDIGQKQRDEERAAFQKGVSEAKQFFSKAAYERISGNNVLVSAPGLDTGAIFIPNNGYGFSVEGFGWAAGPEGCPAEAGKCDIITIKHIGYPAAYLKHELLHDAWYAILNEGQRADFALKTGFFFSIAGSTLRDDAIIMAGLSGGTFVDGHLKPGELINGKYRGEAELIAWAVGIASRPGSPAPKEIAGAIWDYIQIRSLAGLALGYGISDSERGAFLAEESFAYMGTAGVPAYLGQAYAQIIDGASLVNVLRGGSGYFATEEKFRALVPYIEGFVAHMKSLHPELNQIQVPKPE